VPVVIGVCTREETVSTTATVLPGLATLAPVLTYAVGVVGVAAADPDAQPASTHAETESAATEVSRIHLSLVGRSIKLGQRVAPTSVRARQGFVPIGGSSAES
jgi:uncharacterized membrane protein